MTILALLTFAICAGTFAYAQEEGWMNLKSDTGLFEVLFPKENFKEDFKFLRLSTNAVMQYGTARAMIDQRPYKNEVKTHLITITQTFGSPFTAEERGRLILEEIDRITQSYKEKKGQVIEIKDDIWQGGFPGGEVYLSYQDPEFGKQYARTRFFVTDVSKIQQTVLASSDTINTYKSRDYFNSLVLHEGYTFLPGKFSEDWKTVNSPLGIFTTFLPNEAPPYVPEAPKVDSGKNSERVFTRFYDPIWKQHLIFSTYGYILDRDLNYENVTELMKNRHILKHRFKDKGVVYSTGMNGKIPIVEAQYTMDPPKGYPYIQHVKIRAQFYKNKVIVNEVMASKKFINSPLVKILMASGTFSKPPAASKAPPTKP